MEFSVRGPEHVLRRSSGVGDRIGIARWAPVGMKGSRVSANCKPGFAERRSGKVPAGPGIVGSTLFSGRVTWVRDGVASLGSDLGGSGLGEDELYPGLWPQDGQANPRRLVPGPNIEFRGPW